MDCVQNKARMNVEVDRLSMLPDDLIHKILSFISTEYVIRTSALSSRWRFLWTSMPYLNISFPNIPIYSFPTLPHFSEFVNRVLSGRDSQIDVYSVKLRFHSETFSQALLKQVLDYAFSHNVQQLTIKFPVKEKIEFPLNLFRSGSLKYLKLAGRDIYDEDYWENDYSIVLTSTWELPALTTLHLETVAFNEDSLFSKCANLKNLILNNFTIWESFTFTLCHPRLSNLTLNHGMKSPSSFNVVAPQLRTLIIRSFSVEHQITAPNFSSLLFHVGDCYHLGLLQFSTDLPFLEKVDLRIRSTRVYSSDTIMALLQQLNYVKYLTLNLESLKSLISYVERNSLPPSPFSNLKSLKIYPVDIPSDYASDAEEHKKVIMTSKVKSYLLDGSPSAIFTLISYEEIEEKKQKAQAIKNAVTVRKLMADLRVRLENEKDNIETNLTPMESHKENDTDDQGKSPMEIMQLHFNRKMAQLKRGSKDFFVRIDQGNEKTRVIISQLRDIEVLLLKDLPTPKMDELQACFSSLCAEADTVVKEILRHMMIHQIHLNHCFNELATASLLSS